MSEKEKRKKYRVIVVHPGKQHSYRLAEALEEKGYLYKYITTVYNAEHSLTHFLGSFLRGDARKRFLSRKSDVFDEKVKTYCEARGLLFLMLIRIPKARKLAQLLENHLHDRVYSKAIKYAVKQQVDAIIFYDRLGEKHLKWLKNAAANIKCIVDFPTCTRSYVQKIEEEDARITGDDFIFKEQADSFSEQEQRKENFICQHADGFLAGSSFVKMTIMESGTREKQIKVVPYGVDSNLFGIKDFSDSSRHKSEVEFIYVGRVNRRKGLQHLLPAFERLEPEKARLTVVGQYDSEDTLYTRYRDKENIVFTGFIIHNKLVELYHNADVFVLPSLAEGMGQVALEAMGCGLPVICTENCGCSDIIERGKSGVIVPVSNQDKILEAMTWFINNKEKIIEMGQYAHDTAVHYTWDYYKENIVKAVEELMKE